MSLDKSLRKLLGLPIKEDRLIAQIENLKTKTDMCIIIPSLTAIMTDEVIPRLEANIHDLEAIGMLEQIIKQFEELEKIEPSVKNILKPLYDNRDYVYEQNGMKVKSWK